MLMETVNGLCKAEVRGLYYMVSYEFKYKSGPLHIGKASLGMFIIPEKWLKIM